MKDSLPFLVLMLCASVAFAEPPASAATQTQKAASALVEKQLLRPLKRAESKRRRFSRAAVVPVQRRVRVLDPVAQTDARGKKFLRFAVDVSHPRNPAGQWQKDALLGCAYPDEKRVFVQRGDEYLPARSVLAGDDTARPDVCRAVPNGEGQLAAAAG